MDISKFYGILSASTPWIYLNFMGCCQSMPEHITLSIMTSLLLVYYYSSVFGLLLPFVQFYHHQTLQHKMAASTTKGRIFPTFLPFRSFPTSTLPACMCSTNWLLSFFLPISHLCLSSCFASRSELMKVGTES